MYEYEEFGRYFSVGLFFWNNIHVYTAAHIVNWEALSPKIQVSNGKHVTPGAGLTASQSQVTKQP